MEDYGLRKFNYPTTIYLGDRAIEELCIYLNQNGFKRLFLVTDIGLAESDLVSDVYEIIKSKGLQLEIFDKVHPNPTEDDVLSGTRLYKEGRFDGLIALGGGSAIDAAKAIKILSSHFEPLGRYDDTKEGWRRITNPMPEIFAIPTIAGTGREVGGC
jgi:alcohol dehydrogenase class IV